jgi:hypothetical protein
MLKAMIIFMTFTFLASAAEKQLKIPAREHGYSQLQSHLINSQQTLNDFITAVKKQKYWNNQAQFLKVLTQSKIDFSQNNLVFLKHTEGSGSIKVSSELKVEKGQVKITINRKGVGGIGTADMAYYCFAYKVPKKSGKKIVLESRDNNKFVYLLK